jgi:hypothetical protein
MRQDREATSPPSLTIRLMPREVFNAAEILGTPWTLKSCSCSIRSRQLGLRTSFRLVLGGASGRASGRRSEWIGAGPS